MTKTNLAIDGFRTGLNCAQAVLGSFSDQLGMDHSTAMSISCGFGAGMGRLQETCGAVTGAFMVLGLHNCKKYHDNNQRKENTYLMIREFDNRFSAIHGTICCRELLQVDLKTPEGQKAFHDDNLKETICEKCIADAIELLEKMTE